MAVFRSEAVLLGDGGARLGAGMAYLHLPRGEGREQDVSGTMSLKSWDAAEGQPVAIQLSDQRTLTISVSRDALSECSRNRVLRFQAHWPPHPS